MEMVLGALAEAIFAILIEDLAQQPRLAGLREKLRGESPEKLAFKRALVGAYDVFRRRYPQLAAAFFDEHFLLEKPGVKEELSKLLTPTGKADAKTLEQLWQSQFSSEVEADLSAPIDDFLKSLSDEIKAQPLLKPFVDSRAFDQLYAIAEGTRQQVDLQTEMVRLMTEVRDLLAGSQPQPPPISTFATTAEFARTPDEVPERPRKLIGRDDLLAQVHAALDRGEHVLLQGFGGMGKTALAATVAAQRTMPILWLKAGNAEADALFEALARPFDALQKIARATGEAKIAVMRDLLAEKGLKLLVLDDAWNGEVLKVIMDAVPRSLPMLITSRHVIPIDDEIIVVDELDPDRALELLGYYAHQDYAADAGARNLCNTLGYHAYALEIAGRTLRADKFPPAELLRKIVAAPHAMQMPEDFARAGRQSIGDLIEVSLNAVKEIDETAYFVFLAFGALFAPSATPLLLMLFFVGTPEISEEQLAAARERLPDELKQISDDELKELLEQIRLQNVDAKPVEKALTLLQRRGLAERIPDSSIAYYRIHDLAYSYARAQITDDGRHRALDACRAYTWRYNEPSLENFAALRPELPNFMGAAAWSFAAARYEDVERFAWNLYTGSEILDLQGYYTQAVELLAQAARAAEKQGKRRDQGAHLGNLGNAYRNLGQYQRAIAYYEQALTISREIENKRDEGNSLGSLGNAYFSLGQYQRAIAYHEQALVISREIGDRRSEGSDLGSLGSAYAALGQYQRAIEYHEQALDISREIGDRRNEGNWLGNLGNAYRNLGQYQRAIEHYEQALTIQREIGDRHGEGNSFGNLGIAYADLGQVERAIEYHEQALVIRHEIGDRHGEGSDLGSLGLAYRNLGQYQRAIAYHEQALDISREIGDKQNEGNQLGNLGNAYFSLGQYQRAIAYHEQALDISREIGDRLGEGNRLGNLGIAYAALEQVERAIEYHEQALTIHREIGDKRGEGGDLGNLGNTYRNLGQYQRAIEYHEQALVISREIGDKQGEASHLNNMGALHDDQGDYPRAIEYYQQAHTIFAELHLRHLVEKTEGLIAAARAAQSGAPGSGEGGG